MLYFTGIIISHYRENIIGNIREANQRKFVKTGKMPKAESPTAFIHKMMGQVCRDEAKKARVIPPSEWRQKI